MTHNIEDIDMDNQYFDPNDFSDLCNSADDCMFSVLHFNIRSFNSNPDELFAFLDQLNVRPSVVVLTETWFSPAYSVDIEGYCAYHVYREVRRGGGVTVYVRKDYVSRLIQRLTYVGDNIEICSVEVTAGSSSIVIHGVYRPPDNDISSFTGELLNVMSAANRRTHNIVIGDTNVDLCNPSQSGTEFVDMCHASSFVPLITIPTRVTQGHVSCIDHIWFNQLSDVSAGVFEIDITDHYPIFAVFPIRCRRGDSFNKYFRDHSFTCIANLREKVYNFCSNFELSLFESYDVDIAVQTFHDKLYQLYNECCPIRSKRVSYNRFSKPWITNQHMTYIAHKHHLFYQYKHGIVTFDIYKNFNNYVTRLLRTAKAKFFRNKFDSAFGNAKDTWGLVNSLIGKGRKRVFPERIVSDADILTDSSEIANFFNTYFASVANSLDREIPASDKTPVDFMGNRTRSSFFVSPVSEGDVSDIIVHLGNKSSGLKSIPIFVYKTLNDLLSPIIAQLFNRSVVCGIFPACLKVARITPIYKQGDRTLVKNYRPISVLSTLSKVFERLMCRRLVSFLKVNGILFEGQFGFRENSSTSDAVVEFLDRTVRSIDGKQSTIAIFLDFAKAFDTVCHRILVDKLEHVGIRGSVLDWFRTYLYSRKQYVCISDSKSEISVVEKGVPQGSVLGPILFLIYINDMRLCSDKLGFVHYADDTTVFYSGERIEDLTLEVNAELVKLYEWLKANRLSLNTDKTKFMIFTDEKHIHAPVISIANVNMQETDRSNFLGIIIDNKLTFRPHVSNLCGKISSSIGLINRISNIVPPLIKKKLYYSYVYSKVSYGILAWGKSGLVNANRVERLLHRARKVVDYPHTGRNIVTDDLLNFQSIYKYFAAVNLYKILKLNHHQYFCSLLEDLIPQHSRATRFMTSDRFNVPRYSKSKTQRHFLYQSVHVWNNISEEVKASRSLIKFRKMLKQEFLLEQ